MGWCSGGTHVFDEMCGAILSEEHPDKKQVLIALIDALHGNDWDCEPDSKYWDHPLVREIFKEKYPNWFVEDE